MKPVHEITNVWERVSRIHLARLLKQLPKDERYKELKRIQLWHCFTKPEQGSALTPVIAILTAFTVAAVLIAQSGLLHTICARLAAIQ